MVTPTGDVSLPLHYMREALAASSTFRTWTGTADEAAARARVHIPEAAASDDLPLATVECNGGYSWRKHAGGQRNYFEASGRLAVEFFAAIADDDPEDALYNFTNNLGAVLDDVRELAGQAGYLAITDMDSPDGPQRGSLRYEKSIDIGEIYHCRVIVAYEGVG